MPAASSIYWNSQDSQKSSGDGSEPRSSSSSSSDRRSYIDPWDLENYAYLRRRQNLVVSPRNDDHRLIQPHNISPRNNESSSDSYYWYPSTAVMPDQSGFGIGTPIEELYHEQSRRHMQQANLQYPVQQPSYEEDARYVTPNPVYVPLSDLEQSEDTVDHPWPAKLQPRRRNRPIKNMAYHKDECPCPYHGPLPDTPGAREAGVTPPKQLGLNTYGHLRIDYAKSWNSLHRKMKN